MVEPAGSFDISGGLVVATGSSGMAMAPSTSSAQRSLLATFATQAAGTVVHVVAADGTPIVTFAPSKAYQALTVSSPPVLRSRALIWLPVTCAM